MKSFEGKVAAMPTQGGYNASKFAVCGYTKALRMELNIEGVSMSATCVHPGGVAANIATAARIDDNVQRNARRVLRVLRVLIGSDARRVDFTSRLMGSACQTYVLRFHRKMQARRASNPHAVRPARATASTPKDMA